MRGQSPEDLDLTDPSAYRQWTTITIRYRDLDPLRHINNSVYSEWFEAARVILTTRFSAAGPDWLVTALQQRTMPEGAHALLAGEGAPASALLSYYDGWMREHRSGRGRQSGAGSLDLLMEKPCHIDDSSSESEGHGLMDARD